MVVCRWSWKCSGNITTGTQKCDQHHLLTHCEMAYDIANNTIGHSHPGDVRDCSNDCQSNGYTVPGGLPCLSVVGIQQAGMIGEEQWDEASSTPFLRWHDNDPALELWYILVPCPSTVFVSKVFDYFCVLNTAIINY